MTAAKTLTTADDLLRESSRLGRCELIRGEIRLMSPSGWEHGRIASRLDHRLRAFVEPRGLGEVCGAETGYVLARDPDTVRAPDVSFIARDRVPVDPEYGFLPIAPDLAVEVLSPSDRPGEVRGKVADWLAAGCRAVWVVDPRRRTVEVHRPDITPVTLTEADDLAGDPELPGFRLSVRDIFARAAGPTA